MEDREIASVYRAAFVCGGIVSVASLAACTALFIAGLWWQPIIVMLHGALCTDLVMKGWQVKVSSRSTKEKEKQC